VRPARTRIFAKLDRVTLQQAEVTLDRAAGLFTVRGLRRRHKWELPTSTVAQMVVERVIRADLAEKRREKEVARKARRKS
jgi:hypothetical protein